MVTATFDIGTTAVKAVAVKDDGTAVYTGSAAIETIGSGGFREQRPEDWYQAFRSLSAEILAEIPAEEIRAVIFSGQMQDVIPVDEAGLALRPAILYSDGRAALQAARILRAVGAGLNVGEVSGDVSGDVLNVGESSGDAAGVGEMPGFEEKGAVRIARITGNHFDGSMPLAKILWIKENEPELYARTACFLISSKDYVIARLTGAFVGDMTACATAGAMDLKSFAWSEELIRAAGLSADQFPALHYPHELAGTVSERAAAETGYRPGTRVYTGTGDAGATTLASGIVRSGEFNINLGTSGWVAAVSDGFMEAAGGGFNLAAMQPGKYINVVPFFNGGNVHKFLAKIAAEIAVGSDGPDYKTVSGLLKKAVPGSHGTYFLPYLAGERFPVMDADIRGGYLGLSPETTASDLMQSALEGVAYSIRQGIETFKQPVKRLTLIGGGARETAWCQILSDVTGQAIAVYRDPDLLPALAIAAAVLLAEGVIADYSEFISGLEAQGHCDIVTPDPEAVRIYADAYERYKKIYPLVREFYLHP